MSYCKYVETLDDEAGRLHKRYHDHFYGFPIEDDNELFCRLVLEINQAGLSWGLILRKEAGFREAFDQFAIEKVAAYGEAERRRLLENKAIVRNRLKIEAAIANAGVILSLQQTHGSFREWLNAHHPMPLSEWIRLFKKTFRFTGGEIVNEFLMSTGYLPGAHDADCPVYGELARRGIAGYGTMS